MKKRNLHLKLDLKKKKIASLYSRSLKGGNTTGNNDPTTVDNSLGKNSTCPIETCTCLEVPIRL